MRQLASSLADWWDHRTGFRGIVHAALYENIPGGSRWRYVWGSTLVFTFVVQVITGLFLWMSYSPSAQTAWESVYYIQYDMQGGWLLRGLHHFTAQAMVVLLALHLLQVVIDSAYKAPREVNFWLGLILMQIVLGLSLTGYLLPWDQKGYWATRVATNLMVLVPGVGQQLQQLVVGGTDYGHHTLTRFFALHAGVLPILLVAFLAIHIYAFRRHGIRYVLPKKNAKPDRTFWPDQVLKDAVACLAVLTVILFFVLQAGLHGDHSKQSPGEYLGADLGAPADGSQEYSAARPEWYFLFLFQLLKYFPGKNEVIGALVVPGIVMTMLALMPFVGRWNLGHRFNVGLIICLLIGVVVLTGMAVHDDQYARWHDGSKWPEEIARLEADGKSQEAEALRAKLLKYQASLDYKVAVEEAEKNAHRARQLVVASNGIPVQGAVGMLRDDPQTQGPLLFAQHCASCHTNIDRDHPGPEVASLSKASAPNLNGFGGRQWISGLLDKNQVNEAHYFGSIPPLDAVTGKPKIDPSTNKPVVRAMVSFVQDDLTKQPWTAREIQQVAIALAAEGHPDAAGKDAVDVVAGGKLIRDESRCGQCHQFHNKVELGSAPLLTGYGSKEWIIGMISNPADKKYYGSDNQRMPAFADPHDAAKNLLAPRTIEMIALWLHEQAAQRDAAASAEPTGAASTGSAPADAAKGDVGTATKSATGGTEKP